MRMFKNVMNNMTQKVEKALTENYYFNGKEIRRSIPKVRGKRQRRIDKSWRQYNAYMELQRSKNKEYNAIEKETPQTNETTEQKD